MNSRFLIGGLPSHWWIQGGRKERAPYGYPNYFITACKRSLGQGNIFTPVCHSVHGGGLPQCMLGYHPPDQAPPGPATPHAHQTRPPRRRTCWEIRSTLGRYASYWNAILFSCSFWQNVCKIIPLWKLVPQENPGSATATSEGVLTLYIFNFLKNPRKLKKIWF